MPGRASFFPVEGVHLDTKSFPNLGFGLGLRAKHYPYIFEHAPPVDWFEIISENFMDTAGRPRHNLARIREVYPVVMHGVSLSIGTVDPLNSEYLTKLKALAQWLEPAWISDHLCWTGVAHRNTHDLLPVPYTEEALAHIISRIHVVQEFLGRPIALENPSTYLEFSTSTIPEAEFISRMAKATGCGLLLDVNNVYVSSYNHRLDPQAYIDQLPLAQVVQIHLSGHTNKGTHIVDTHDDHVIDEVWNLYKYVVNRAGRIPNTMIEWDDRIPEFPVLQAELEKARRAAASPDVQEIVRFSSTPSAKPDAEAPRLQQMQQLLQQSIIAGNDDETSIKTWIVPKENFTPAQQLGVYVDAYRYRLKDVVSEDYPVLAHYLGRDAFDRLVSSFVEKTASEHFNIARYALGLNAFIEKNISDNVFTQELASLETAIAQLMDAPQGSALSKSDVENIGVENLLMASFSLMPAAQLFEFTHDVNGYYSAVMKEDAPEAPLRQPTHLAVFRHENTMWRMELDAQEYALLLRLSRGETLQEALAQASINDPQSLQEWFARWMQHGLLSKAEVHSRIENSGNTHVAA